MFDVKRAKPRTESKKYILSQHADDDDDDISVIGDKLTEEVDFTCKGKVFGCDGLHGFTLYGRLFLGADTSLAQRD